MIAAGRRHMPRRRSGHTTAVSIGTERFYLTANQRDDGSLGEVYIHWGKHGTSGCGPLAFHAEREHLLGRDARPDRVQLVQPGLELRSLPGQVVVQHRLAQLVPGLVLAAEELGPAVHGHGELLPGQVRGADRGPR